MKVLPASSVSGGVNRSLTWIWRQLFRGLLGSPKPMVRAVWRISPGMPFADVLIVGRHSGIERRSLLSILIVDGRWYVGHPNGRSHWARNLTRAGHAVVLRNGVRTVVRARQLAEGPERDAAIRATSQQPFPANLLYRAGRQHIDAHGTYFRLDPVDMERNPLGGSL
jgi:hypothetical protein